MSRINRLCSRETPAQVDSNTQREYEPAEHEHQIIQNQGRGNCYNRRGTVLDNGVKINCIYVSIMDTGKLYTDQTGRFPVVSSKGNKYIMVVY
jgi:hypothetical protein